MLEQIDEKIKNWIQSVISDVAVSFSAPRQAPASCINVYLFDLADSLPASGAQTAPLQFAARYLITTHGEKAHDWLGDLAFAALAGGTMDVTMGGISAETWLALNTIPQPAIVLTEIVRKVRPEPDVNYVRHPIVVETRPTATLVGIVHGPNTMPIMGARIECPSLNRATYSDKNGQFSFINLPTDMPVRLVIRAKGRKRLVDVNQTTSAAQPLRVEFDFD